MLLAIPATTVQIGYVLRILRLLLARLNVSGLWYVRSQLHLTLATCSYLSCLVRYEIAALASIRCGARTLNSILPVSNNSCSPSLPHTIGLPAKFPGHGFVPTCQPLPQKLSRSPTPASRERGVDPRRPMEALLQLYLPVPVKTLRPPCPKRFSLGSDGRTKPSQGLGNKWS